MQKTNAVVVLGTGGTIAGTTAPGADERDYRAAQLGVEELLKAVPGLPPGVVCEQVAQLDSKDMDAATWAHLVERITHHLASPLVAGIVVTHGTDTLEETAYFLQRVLAPAKPVVLTAAMRPATAAAPDGPGNLRDAAAVALDPQASGVLVVMAGEVFAPESVRKAHVSALDAFTAGGEGSLGTVTDLQVTWRRATETSTATSTGASPTASAERSTGARPFGPLPPVAQWPRVDLVASHAGCDGAVVRALVALGTRGIVVVGTGNGTVHQALEQALHEAVAQGVTVWRSTRCAEGEVTAKAGEAFAAAGALTPAKARIGLMLALMDREVRPPSA